MAKQPASGSGDVLESIFAPFWREPQVLPNGYHVVNSISGKMEKRPGRPSSSIPLHKFSTWKAVTDPRFNDPAYADGYAELSVALSRATVEVYKNIENTSMKHQFPVAPSIDEFEGIPSFFPLVRAFINDKAVYQSRVGQLSEAQPVPKTGETFEAFVETEGATPIYLSSVHHVDFNEEVKVSIHTPASVLTLQLFEKDFCADLALSETLIASTSVPVHLLEFGKSIDVLISVHCTLPQAYSVQTLGTSHKLGDNPAIAAINTLPIQEPVAIICRLYVSLALTVPSRGLPLVLREIAALSLARGPWTPTTLVDPSISDDEMVCITGCDLFSLRQHKGPVTLMFLVKALGTLVFALTTGFDALGSEEIVMHLKNANQSGIEDDKALSNSYASIASDLIFLLERVVLGPGSRIAEFVHQASHGKRYLPALVVSAAVWAPVLLKPANISVYFAVVLSFLWYCVSEINLPCELPKNRGSQLQMLIQKVQQIQGAQMFIRPIEQALDANAVRRIRIVELWLRILSDKVAHASDASNRVSSNRAFFNFCFEWRRLVLLCLLVYFRSLRISVGILAAIVCSLSLLFHIQLVAGVYKLFAGIPRYRELNRLRRRHKSILHSSQAPPSGK